MLLVRPVTTADQSSLLTLAELAGIGMTSLPPDPEVLEEKIRRAVVSFAGKPDYQGGEIFLFVLEDTETKQLVGSTAIYAHVGLRHPFYSYKLSTIVQANETLDIYSKQRVLHMVNDYTGATEIGSLFLTAEYRKGGAGQFLSRCRYLMMAEFPDLFDNRVISEIRGPLDTKGNSPFYDNFMYHFFQMGFADADYIRATQGGQFIADLMPKYPIYTCILDSKARACIGAPHADSAPAMHLLKKEGFAFQEYIDIFDAGPSMQAEREQITTVKNSARSSVGAIKPLEGSRKQIISNIDAANFLVVFDFAEVTGNEVTLTPDAAAALNVKKGDAVRVVA